MQKRAEQSDGAAAGGRGTVHRRERRMRKSVKVLLITVGSLLVVFAGVSVGALSYFGSDRPQAYEERIQEFERDLIVSEARGGVLLVGSSYFDNWETSERDLAPLDTLNLGIGGTKIGEQIAFIDRLVVPLAPRALVVYAGSNDISGIPLMTKDPVKVVERIQEYVETVQDRLPGTPVYYVAITEAPVRENVREDIVRANALLSEWADAEGKIVFIDTAPALLTADGEIDQSIFLDDRLHLNEEGYERFSAVIRDRLLADLG